VARVVLFNRKRNNFKLSGLCDKNTILTGSRGLAVLRLVPVVGPFQRLLLKTGHLGPLKCYHHTTTTLRHLDMHPFQLSDLSWLQVTAIAALAHGFVADFS
jgi:hypothetical protein